MKKLWIERFATGNRPEMTRSLDNASGRETHDPKCPIINVCQKCWNHKDLERRKVTVGSDEGSTLMKQIYASNTDPKFEDRYWRIESLTLIENCKLKAQFEAYRSELEKLGRSAEDLKDTLLFSMESERACKEIFEDGCKVGSKKRHVLGHTGNGVHLVRHYDILTRYLMFQQYSSPYVLVYKTFLGKTKPIVPRLHRDDNFVLPHSGFECHVSARNVDKDMPICEALNCSYVYLYEFDDVSSNTVKYPRQILPYAVVQLEKKTPCIPENPFLAFASAESVNNWEVKGETRRGFRFVFSNSGLKGKHKVFAKGYQSGNVGSKLKGQILEMRTKSPKPLLDPKPPLLQKMDDNSLRLSKDYNDEADTTAPPDLQKYGCSPIKSHFPRGTFVFDTDISNFVGSETLRCNPQLKLQPRVKLKRLNSKYYKKPRSGKHSLDENESTVTLNVQVEMTEQNSSTGSHKENDSEENIHKNSKINDKPHTIPNIERQTPLGGSAQSSFALQKQTPPTHLNVGEDSDSVTLRLKTKKSKFGSVKYTIDKKKERKPIKLTSSLGVNERHDLSSKLLTNKDGALGKNQFEFVVQPKDQHDGLKIKIAKKNNSIQDKEFEKLNEKKSSDKVSDANILTKVSSKDKSKLSCTIAPEAGSNESIDIQGHGNQNMLKKILSGEHENHRIETLLSHQAVLEKSKSPVAANSAPDMLNLNPVLVSANMSSLSDRNELSKPTTSPNYGMNMSVHGNSISKDAIFNLEMTSFFEKGKDIDKSERFVHQIHSPIHQTHFVNPVLRAGNDLHKPVHETNMDKDLFNENRRPHVRDFHSVQANETLNTIDISVNGNGDKKTETSTQCVNASSKHDDKNFNNACNEKVGETINDSSIVVHAFATVEPNELNYTLEPTIKQFPSTSGHLKNSESISKNTKGVNSDSDISISNNKSSKKHNKQESVKEKKLSTEKVATSELKGAKKRREKTNKSKDQFNKSDGIIRVNNEVVNEKQKELYLMNTTELIPNVVEPSISKSQHINDQNGCRSKEDIKDNSSNVKIDSTTANKLRSFLSTTAAAALQSKKATSKDTGSFSDTESNSLAQTLSFIEIPIAEDTKLDKSTENNKTSCIPERSYSDTMVVLKQNLPLPSLTSANTSNTFSEQNSDKFPVCSRTDFSEIHENDSQETIIGGVSSSPRCQPGFASALSGNYNLKSFESLLANFGSSSEKVLNIKQEKPDFCPTSQCSENAVHDVSSSSHLMSAKDKTSIQEPTSSTGKSPSIGFNTVHVKQEPIDEELEQRLTSEIEETIENNRSSVLKCLESSTFLPRTRQEIARGVAMLDATECRNAIVDTLKELSNVLKFLTESNGQTNSEQVALVAKKMCSVLGETKVKQEKCLTNQSNNFVSLHGDSSVRVKTEPIETINTFEKNVTDNFNSEEHLSQTFEVQALSEPDCLGTPIHEQEKTYEYIIKAEEEEEDSLKGSTEQYNTKEKDTISNENVKETNKTSDTILYTSERSGIDELPQLLDVGEEPDINGFEEFGLPSKKIKRRKIIFREDDNKTTKTQIIESIEDVKPTLTTHQNSTKQQVHLEEPSKLDTNTDPSLKLLTEIKTEKDNEIQANRFRNKQSFSLKTGVLNKGLKDRKNMFDLKNRSTTTVTSFNAQRIPVISTRVSYPALKIRDVQRTEALSMTRCESDERKSSFTQFTNNILCSEERKPNFQQFSNNIVCGEQRKSNFQQSTNNILDDVYTTVCEKLMTLKTEKEIIPNDLSEFSVNTERPVESVAIPAMVIPTDLCQTLPLVLSVTPDNTVKQTSSSSSNNNTEKLVPDNTKPKEKSRIKNESKQVIPFHTVKRLKQHQFWKYKRGETNRKFIDYKEIFDKMRKGKLDEDLPKKSKSVKKRDDNHSKKSKSVERINDGHSKRSKSVEKRDGGHPKKSNSVEKRDSGHPIKSKSDEKRDDGHPKKAQSVEKRNDDQPKKSNSVEKINSVKSDIDRTRRNASKFPFPIPSNRKAQISARGATLIEDEFVFGRRPVFISQKRRRSPSSVRDNPKKPRNSFERSHNRENPKRDGSRRSRSKSSHRSSDKTQSRNSKHKSHSPSSKRSSSRNEDRAPRRNYTHRNTTSNNNLNVQDTCKPISRWSLTQRFPAKAVFAKSGTGYFSWRRKYQTKRIANEEYVLTEKGTLQTKAEYDRWTRFKARESLRLQIETAIKDYRRTFKDTPDDKTGDEKVASYLEFLSGKLDELKSRRNKLNPNPPKKVDPPKQQNNPARKKNNRRRRKQNKANQEKRLLEKLERSRMFHHHETLQHSSIARLSSTLASDSDSLSYKQRRHATSIEELLREHISKHCETLTKQIKQEITQEFEELANSKVDLQRNKGDERQTSSRSRDKYQDRDGTRRTKDGDRYDKDSRHHRTRFEKHDKHRRSSRDRCSTSQSSDKSKEERDRRGRKDNSVDKARERYAHQDLSDDRHSDQYRHEDDDIIDGNSSSTNRERYSAYPDDDRRIIDVHILPERRFEERYFDDKDYVDPEYYPREIDKYDFQQNFDKYQFEFDRQRRNVEHTHIPLQDPIEQGSNIPHELKQPHFPPYNRRQWFSGKYDRYRYNGGRLKIPLLETPKDIPKTNPVAETSDEYDATKYRQLLPSWRVNQGRGRCIPNRSFHPFYNPKPHNPKPHYQPAKYSKPFRNPATYYFYEGDKDKKLDSGKVGAPNHANPLEITAELRSDEADPTSRTKGPVDVPKPVQINSGVRTTSVE